MNRAQRRAKARDRRGLVAACNQGGKIPVIGKDDRVLALVRPVDVKFYEAAPNAKVDHKDGAQVIVLENWSDDTSMMRRRGNPKKYSSDKETQSNPRGVWNLRRLGSNDAAGEAFVRRIYRASVLDNLVGRPPDRPKPRTKPTLAEILVMPSAQKRPKAA